MRRWFHVLVVGVLTVLLSIDSASACRLLRSRCRPRCCVVSCRVVHPVEPRCVSVATCQPCMIVESLPTQCCVPADGSAHAVIVEPEPPAFTAPIEAPLVPAAEAAPVFVDAPRPAEPTPVTEPLEPLAPIEPASAEKPLTPVPAAVPEPAPVPEPRFKTAAEILAESAEKERLEKAAAEAAAPPAPAAEPPMKKEAPAEPAPALIEEPPAPIEPVTEKPAPAPVPEEPETPAEPAPKKPAPKPAEENFFDDEDEAPEQTPETEGRAPMKKKEPPQEPVEDLFGEPEAETPPADAKPESTEEPADEAPSEGPTEKTENDPFATLDATPEPVRRWIDSSGRHETIGRLVEVHADRVRILKLNGRHTTVPLQRLSQHDQDYAATVGERLAGRAPARPATTDTARR